MRACSQHVGSGLHLLLDDAPGKTSDDNPGTEASATRKTQDEFPAPSFTLAGLAIVVI